MNKIIAQLLSILLLITNTKTFSQCGMFELPLSQKVENSNAIFEGKVLSKQCFWNPGHTLIFTSNIIEVYKIFKGNITQSTVEIITEGGVMENEMQTIEPNLTLDEGDIGIFMVETTNLTILNGENKIHSFKCYGNSQGFFKYDLTSKTATVPFKQYTDILSELYLPISKLSGKMCSIVKSFDIHAMPDIHQSILRSGVSISGFSPASISAGTGSILTINGSGFGATQGSSIVNFKNADDGGISFKTPVANQYFLWSDSQIKVKVPSKAGTGTIDVVVGGTATTSTNTLTITYSEINAVPDPANTYQTYLVSLNNTGGITWQMQTDFDNNVPAKEAFKRALLTWNAGSKINWEVGSTTVIDSNGRDHINVVRFDIDNELPAGTLARCNYYWVGCSPSLWFVSELDMVADAGTNWDYGPGAPSAIKYDFETVMLHELGHGHQLGHVIDTPDVMHYSTFNGASKRILNNNNISGSVDIMSRSKVTHTCDFGKGPMSPATGIIDFNYTNYGELKIFPNPSSGVITIDIPYDSKNRTVEVINSLGEVITSVNQNNYFNKTNIDLSNLTNGVYNIVVHSDNKITFGNFVLLR